jgi:hypothetical protein
MAPPPQQIKGFHFLGNNRSHARLVLAWKSGDVDIGPSPSAAFGVLDGGVNFVKVSIIRNNPEAALKHVIPWLAADSAACAVIEVLALTRVAARRRIVGTAQQFVDGQAEILPLRSHIA